MTFKSIMRHAVLVAGLAAGWAGSAQALLLSDITGGQTLTVGNLIFEFDSCSGNCTSDIEIVGVPASASTGPGGGIKLVPITGSSIVDPNPAHHEITLAWFVDVIGGANTITGVSGSAIGVQGAGTGSIGTTVVTESSGYTYSPGTVTTNINGTNAPVTLALMEHALSLNTDINVTADGGTTITEGNIFVSQVPEPATIGLLLTGVLGLAGLRRRAV